MSDAKQMRETPEQKSGQAPPMYGLHFFFIWNREALRLWRFRLPRFLKESGWDFFKVIPRLVPRHPPEAEEGAYVRASSLVTVQKESLGRLRRTPSRSKFGTGSLKGGRASVVCGLWSMDYALFAVCQKKSPVRLRRTSALKGGRRVRPSLIAHHSSLVTHPSSLSKKNPPLRVPRHKERGLARTIGATKSNPC
jgi:hypothetical protein